MTSTAKILRRRARLSLASSAPRSGRCPDSRLAKLEVFPPDVNLTTARDRQSLVVQATYADGITRDVTAEATLTLANPALVRRDGHTFYPVADGDDRADRRLRRPDGRRSRSR